jgi:stage V sporulation protein B
MQSFPFWQPGSLREPLIGDENLIGKFGAAGGTLGTGAGVVTGLIFMGMIYAVNSRTIRKRIGRDSTEEEKSYRQVFGMIFMMVTPIILATCVYNVSSIIDQIIFTRLMVIKGFTETQISAQYALFGYKFKPIINIPIALASATSTALIPAVAASLAEKRKSDAVARIDESVRFTMFLAIPSAIGMCILSYPIVRILYPSGNIKDAAVLISLGSVSVIFYCLSTVTNGVLQGLGKPSIPVIDSAIALGVNVVLLALGVWVLDMGVVAILMATVMYSMTVSALNSMFVKKYLNYQNEIKTSFLLPLAAGAVMGAAVGILYWIPVKVFSGFFKRYIPHALWTVIVVLIGMVVYVVAYALISGKSEEELRKLPAGTRIVQLLHFLHIRRA